MPRDGKYHKGRFNPRHPEKYKGDVRNIVYRSSWELEFMRYCDRTNAITEWGSEEFSIPYVSPVDNRVHRYYPDFIIRVNTNEGRKTYIVEVKPKKQCSPPVPGKKKTKSFIYESIEYAKNQAKWKAAEEFCKDNRVEFKVITEDHLGIKPYKQKRRK